eukprot:1778704-Rhodomonas_salina.8
MASRLRRARGQYDSARKLVVEAAARDSIGPRLRQPLAVAVYARSAPGFAQHAPRIAVPDTA